MAINKKLITFDKKLTFLGANGINNLSSPVDGYYNLIPTWSMVFIKDTGEIWHDGVYFGKPIKDQIAPIMSGTTKGIVFTPNGTDYYYKDFNLWGNTFDGDTKNINGDLVVQGVTYKWTYGDLGIKKGNTNLISFSNSANDYDVFIPNGDLLVTGGDINVNNGKVILDSTGYIKGTHILNTNSYFNADNTLGKTWSSIKQFNTSGTTISLDTTRPAIINIQEHAHASGTLWVPWIAGGDITEQSSWGIGLGGDTFYIGRIAKSHTENSLSQYWKFSPTDGLCLSGTTKYIKVEGLTNASQHIFMADGTVKSLSDISSEALIGEATTSSYGGFKLTQDKASVQQNLVNNTTGNGRYAVKMNANGTLYVEFSQANTWLPATNAQEGYVPMLETSSDSIGSQLNEYVLTFEASEDETITPTWKRLPENAFNDTTYSTATNSALGLVKVGSTLDSTTGYTAVKIKDGVIYYHDTTYSFSNLAFKSDVNTTLMNYNSLAARTVLAGTNITFTHSDNVLTISSTNTWDANTKDAAGYVAAPKSGNSYLANKVWKTDNSGNPGWRDDDNTWDAASTSKAGYVPKLVTTGGTIASSDTAYVLTYRSGVNGATTPVWMALPNNAYDNTTYSKATSSILGLVKIGTTLDSSAGYTKVHIDSDGIIYYHDTTYSTASNSALGLVKTGTAIADATGYTAVHIKDGVIYYKDTNTHYTANPILGNSSATSNASSDTTNSTTYLNIIENSAKSGSIQITGSGGTSVKAKNGVLTISSPSLGTGASDAAKGNHDHTLSIATDNGTNEVSLSAGTKYKLTAGGKTLIFTTPSDANTQYKLKVNGTTNGTSGGTDLGTLYAVATSDATAKDQVWMRNSSNNGYGWRTLGSHAFDSTTYSTTDENVKQTPKTDNVNRPLMMINGGTSQGEQVNTSMFCTGIYANASTKTIYATIFNGTVNRTGSGVAWVNGRTSALLRETSSTGYHALWSLKTTNGSWDFGEYNTSGWYDTPVLTYITDANFNAGNNSTTYQILFPKASGTVALTSQIPTVNNASLTLQTAGTTLTTFYANDSTNRTFNVTCANIGAATSGHTHRYINSSGFSDNGSTTLSTWGTLTSANSYTGMLNINESGGGSWEIAAKSGQISMLIDGYYYQNEGRYRTTDVTETVTALSTSGNYLTWTKNGSTNNITVPYATNADKVDGIHASGLLTAASLGTSGNSTTISVTVGGTTKTGSITVPYATNSTSTEYLNNHSTSDPAASKQDLKVKWFASIGSTVGGSAGYAGNNYGFPCSNNANGILWLGTHSGNYGGQLGISSNGSIYYRFISAGSFPTTANGGSWVRLVTSSNYTDYTVTKTGSGASGTWGINVTGSAGSVAWGNVTSKPATATRWPAWSEITSKPTTLSGYGITDGLYSTQVSTAQTDLTYAKNASKTIRRGFVYNTSGTEWSYLFGFTSGTNSSTGYPNYGAVYKFGYTDRYIRVLRVSGGGTWLSTDWEKIYAGYADSAGNASTLGGTAKSGLFTDFSRPSSTNNLSITIGGTTKAVTLGARAFDNTAYLPLSGGTMTGALTVKQYILGYNYNHAGGNAPAFVFDKPGSNYTGIGANGEADTIYFSAATLSKGEASWVTSYKQKWKFNGTIYQEGNAVIHAGNIGSQSVNYATSAGNADTVDGKHANDFALAGHTHSYLPVIGTIGMPSIVDNPGQCMYTIDGNPSTVPSGVNMVSGDWNQTWLDLGPGWTRRKRLVFNYSNDNIYYVRRVDSRWTSPVILIHSGGGQTINGNLTATNFYTTSDRNKKTNISSFSEHIRKFQLKDTEKWHYGVIAQEVSEMFRDGEEGNMTVNYNSVLSYYIGCLENKVKELEEKIKLLETKQI